MNTIKEKIGSQIEKLKIEILDITNQIETIRSEGDEADVGISSELQDRLELLSERISILQRNLSIYSNSVECNDVCIGKTVEISNDRIKGKQITIVLPEDADSQGGFISAESPLGQALLDTKEGEKVEFDTPNGNQEFEVNKIL